MGMLSDTKVRGAKGTGKAYKLSDGEQLYLHVSAVGGRVWRMNYQFGRNAQGKPAQKTLTIGPYPAISLKDARDARDLAKSMLAKGIEPRPGDLFERGAGHDTRPTFKGVAMAWHKLQMQRWSKVHAKDVLDCLEKLVFPVIGDLAIEDIQSPEVLRLLQKIVEGGAIETAHRTRQRISAIFVYGIATIRPCAIRRPVWPSPCPANPRPSHSRPSPTCRRFARCSSTARRNGAARTPSWRCACWP
jgi:hypothetical protein